MNSQVSEFMQVYPFLCTTVVESEEITFVLHKKDSHG